MKLSQKDLPKYFTLASPRNSHYEVITNTFDFIDRRSNVLVVTTGESWTWGSDLGDDCRLHYVFGNTIAESLGADWLNLAVPGASNFFIAERIEELGDIVPGLAYDKIYCICTFTEIGRGFNSHHDTHIDYIKWFESNEINHVKDFDHLLAYLNQNCLERIRYVANTHDLKLLVGSNFVDSLGINHDPGYLGTPWFRLLGISCDTTVYAGSTGVDRLKQLIEFVPQNKLDLFKLWFIELIEQAKCVDTICNSKKLVRAHPTKDGHKIWADYILEHMVRDE